MTTPLSGTVLFQDDFNTNGQLNSANWDYNHWTKDNNASYLGQTQMRQSLPFAENGMARIKMDTFNPPPGGPDSYYGSEAITNQAWDISGGGLAFEGKFRFDGNQGGMIAGFFSFEQFPTGAAREIHDEIDFEIITTQMQKISTNIFQQQKSGTPQSIAVDGGLAVDHVYRFEWTSSVVRWFVDGKLIREDTQHVPTKPQQLHINLWGAPQAGGPNGGPWGKNPGDPTGPNITDPTLLIAPNASQNKSYYFDVDYVKVERLATQVGDHAANAMLGSAAPESIDGAGGDDSIDGGGGDDTLFGDAGNDTVMGGAGNDTIYGGTGVNTILGGAGADRVNTSAGADTVRDTLANLNGDTVAGFGSDDVVDIQGVRAGRSDLTVSTEADGVSLQVGGSTFKMEGDYSNGDFMMATRGSGADAHTLVSFQSFLPTLAEGRSVAPEAMNGVINQPFLTGDGATDFSLELRSATSEYRNTLGTYKVAADGTIHDVQVLFDNTLNVAAAARTVDLGTPADGERVAFFLIQNGFKAYGALPHDLSFITPGTGGPADLDSGLTPLLFSATRGVLDDAAVFHSFSTLNRDDATQVLSGVAPGGHALLIGFEDLPNATGDKDFQDVVIAVRPQTDDLLAA